MIARYCGAVALTKLVEFAFCGAIASALIHFSPRAPQEAIRLVDSLQGGYRLIVLFYGVAGYAVLSAGLLGTLAILLIRSKAVLAASAASFFLGYSAYVAVKASTPFPTAFWIAWTVMGVIVFWLHYVVMHRVAPHGESTISAA